MRTFVSAIAITLCVGVSPCLAAETAIPRDPFTLAEYPPGFAPNRLDIYDLKRELAREAEHRRIHTRLGDPGRFCRPAAVGEEPGAPSPGLLIIVCR
jgi:hypothetical protein